MAYAFRHPIGSRVAVSALPAAGDALFEGRVGTVVGHDLTEEEDRTWPEVMVLLDGSQTPVRILDGNLVGWVDAADAPEVKS